LLTAGARALNEATVLAGEQRRASTLFARQGAAVIRGTTTIFAMLGSPVAQVRAPTMYTSYFEETGIDAAFIALDIAASDYVGFVKHLFLAKNFAGAVVTVPHKRTLAVLDEWSATVQLAAACNVIVKRPDGRLYGDLVDGDGFARGLKRAGFRFAGARCLIVGSGGAGAAIAAALVTEGVAFLGITNVRMSSATALVGRLVEHATSRATRIEAVPNDPSGYDLVVNATPLGMNAHDPLPMNITRLAPGTTVADVVMATDITPLLRAASERGCRIHPGSEMAIEQGPSILDLFGLGAVSSDALRRHFPSIARAEAQSASIANERALPNDPRRMS
jgi:shikimate dehydrogenase